MLEQILSDMFIDPHLLAELDDEQKHTLFCRMREEQVRRWKLHEEQYEKETAARLLNKPPIPRKPGKKKVQFLLASNGEPWTWVMGEHENDQSLDNIIEAEVRQRAHQEVDDEQHRRHMVQQELEARLSPDKERGIAPFEWNSASTRAPSSTVSSVKTQIEKLEQNPSVIGTTDQLKEMRATDVYDSIKATQRKAAELWDLIRTDQEKQWQEREKKAKEAEQQIREIARKAREEHKKMNQVNDEATNPSPSAPVENGVVNPPVPVPPRSKRSYAFSINNSRNKSRPSKPPTREAIMEWFKKEEVPRGAGLDSETQALAPWFHGFLTRVDAETALIDKQIGTFLVRVSERIWGYVLSYRAADRCKHFLVDASAGRYQFFGTGHLSHTSLNDLVAHHHERPVTFTGQEVLLSSCPHTSSSLNCEELYKDLVTKH